MLVLGRVLCCFFLGPDILFLLGKPEMIVDCWWWSAAFGVCRRLAAETWKWWFETMIFLFQGCILRFHVNLPGCSIIFSFSFYMSWQKRDQCQAVHCLSPLQQSNLSFCDLVHDSLDSHVSLLLKNQHFWTSPIPGHTNAKYDLLIYGVCFFWHGPIFRHSQGLFSLSQSDFFWGHISSAKKRLRLILGCIGDDAPL